MASTIVKIPIETKTKLDQVILFIRYIAICKGIKLNEAEISIVSHFMLEGYNKETRKEIINNKLCKNDQNLANMIVRLREKGIIVRNGYKEELCRELNIKLQEDTLLMIRLDNRK